MTPASSCSSRIPLRSPSYFRASNRAAEGRAVGLEVPIDVNLVPAKPGASSWPRIRTDTGPRASARAELAPDQQSGHRAEIEARVSQVEQVAEGRYLIPGAYLAPTS